MTNPKSATIKNICVFSSSSNNLNEIYYKTAQELGELIAKSGFNLVYGGSTLGTMGINAKAVKDFGGKVIGIIPEKLHKICAQIEGCDELHVTECMRSRKEKLDKLSDAVIALPGGIGTLEELSEMMVQKQLGYSAKAIVIINTNGYYDNLLKFLDEMIKQNFANQNIKEIVFVAQNPKEAIDYLKNYTPKQFDVYEKLKQQEKAKA